MQMGTKHYMTYTANGAGRAPLNRHQGIASSTAPMQPGSWTRLCTEDSPCLPAGVKSGAMLYESFDPWSGPGLRPLSMPLWIWCTYTVLPWMLLVVVLLKCADLAQSMLCLRPQKWFRRPLPGGGGIMFCYDLRNKSRNTIVARSDDLVHWRLTGQILLPRRQSMWDAGCGVLGL